MQDPQDTREKIPTKSKMVKKYHSKPFPFPDAPDFSELPANPPETVHEYTYSVELVATIALHFLKGPNYDEAVDRAMRLLHACRTRLDVDLLEKERKISAYIEAFIPWNKAVMKVTGIDHSTRAKKAYDEYWSKEYKDDKLAAIKRLQWEEQGMSAADIEVEGAKFRQRNNQVASGEKPKKKTLPKKIPKNNLTMTPAGKSVTRSKTAGV